jgi:hypothetical protein
MAKCSRDRQSGTSGYRDDMELERRVNAVTMEHVVLVPEHKFRRMSFSWVQPPAIRFGVSSENLMLC